MAAGRTTADVETLWSKLADPPFTLDRGVTTQINNCEFIVATEKDSIEDEDEDSVHGLYIFNVFTKAWTLFFEYPKKELIVEPEIVFDKDTNKLHLWHTYIEDGPKQFMHIDMMTKKYISDTYDLGRYEENIVNLKDDIHLIGGWQSINHIKYNKLNKKFTEIHRFKQFEILYGTLSVYIESKNVILIIGGSTRAIITKKKDRHVGVYEYSLKTMKWRKIEGIDYAYHVGNALLTMDERHIILIPTYGSILDERNTIFVLDILDGEYQYEYVLRKSKIELPTTELSRFHMRGNRMCALTGDRSFDEKLILAFIRDLYHDETRLIPLDIMSMIVSFYNCEVLHYLQIGFEEFKNKHQHHVIDVSIVLQ